MPLQHILIEHGAFDAAYHSYPPDTEADCFHVHPEYELYYQQFGSRCLCSEQGTAFLGPGSLALMGGGCIHKTVPADHEPARALVLHFTDAWLAPLRRALPGAPFTELFEQAGPAPVVLAAQQNGLLRDQLEQLRLLWDAPTAAEAARSKLLLAELLLHIRSLPRARPEQRGTAETLVRRAKAYVAARYRDPLDLAAVAAWLGVSRSHLSRTFTHLTGAGLAQYINGVRVQAAQTLLTGPRADKLEIPQIAAQCGFGSADHFRRAFKEITGVTPGRYRSAARQTTKHSKQ